MAIKTMKLSDYVINYLSEQGINCVFEVCGGAITHLIDSLYERKDINAISVHHEQAAAFAAEGYARVSGNLGIAMATSGPGATNLITGIASCYFDSIPSLFITGQVNTYEFKFDKPVRQIGFQETDIVRIVRPVVKDAILVENPKKIKYYLEKLVCVAKSGRPGPVLLDIPMNIQRADIDPEELESFYDKDKNKSNLKVDIKRIKKIAKVVKSAFRPVVLAGGGVRLSGASEELSKFISKTKIPVVVSLMGLDAFPHKNQSFVGMIGTYGNRYANLTIANADMVLVLGTRLDTRQTGTKPETFARGARIIHVDVDPNELDNKIKAKYAIESDIKVFLKTLNKYVNAYDVNKTKKWRKTIKGYKRQYPSYRNTSCKFIDPNLFIHQLSDVIPEGAVICADVGQNQIWTAQSLSINKTQRFLTQGGMGAMGSALSMAIGASFAKPNKLIIVITGDGGFQLNIQELETIYNHKLPIKIIMLNNHCYGMIRQFQEQYFDARFQSSVIGYSAPDFQDVVSAYKIPVNRISCGADVGDALKKLFRNTQPMFLEVDIKSETQVMPKLSVNKPIEDQDPLLSRKELQSNMFVDLLYEGDNK